MTSAVGTQQKSARPRGRPRNLDSAVMPSTIRACFARKGFSGTSIEDLSEATGLGTPSLYNAFGDKRQMFLKSLDLEYEDVVSRLRSVTTEAPLADRLRAYLEAATVGYREYDPIPGIAFGAALADTSDDPEVARRVRDFSTELELVAADVLGPDAPSSSAGLLSTLATGLCLRLRSCASSLGSLEHAASSLLALTKTVDATGDARRTSVGAAA
ncbi:transcriptional regulator, TetR family [Bradyrhizobium erythrophlei]|nr:transcriptional regulator, TetR family [Bradyrhizobium erythrophlei]